jgi:coenzyme F420-dependent glucose-6-phosphate dehydrogenase
MDTIGKMTLVVSSAEEAMKKLDKYVRLGFTEIVLINSSPNREIFIKLLSQEISPVFRDANKPPAKAETTT